MSAEAAPMSVEAAPMSAELAAMMASATESGLPNGAALGRGGCACDRSRVRRGQRRAQRHCPGTTGYTQCGSAGERCRESRISNVHRFVSLSEN
jgi:hypothetical protein